MNATSRYVYSNTSKHADAHHRHLSAILDRETIARLSLIRPLSGLRCLEVGAGAGSIAAWLAHEVAPAGEVVATDLRPLHIPHMRRLRVLRHDITVEPVPDPPYDLIHARLVLMHLPQRVQVLRTLIEALKPGGVLVVEEWAQTWREGRVLCTPSPTDKELFELFHDCLTDVFADAGVDLMWASSVAQHMVDLNLVDVSAKVTTESWPGGSPGCLLVAGSAVQLHDQLIMSGLNQQDLDRVAELMHDPRMVIRMPPFVSTVGHRP